MNFDHLSLLDPGNKYFQKVNQLLLPHQEDYRRQMAFSDVMFHYDQRQHKQKVIVLITNNHFFLLTP